MRIAIFTDTYLPQINGVVFSTHTFAKEFEAMGHEVLIIAPQVENGKESTDSVWRFKSLPFPFQPEHRITSPLSRKLRDFGNQKIDIIHIQTPFFMGHLGQYLGWRHKIPIVHTYHTFWAEYLHYFPLLPKGWRRRVDLLLLSKNFCNRCQHIVVPSVQIQDALEGYEVRKPISVIPTGITVNRVIEASAMTTFRETWKLSVEDKVCIFVGRLGKEKNVYFLLDAFAKLHQENPKTKLILVGDGPEREPLRSHAEKLHILDVVVFCGYLGHEDVFVAYAASDVILFPSKTETQGLSLLEGMSIGKPAVCLNALGVKQLLENECGGFLTEENIADYVTATKKLLDDPALYTQKSIEAKSRASEFSSTQMAKKMLAVYQGLLSS
jgi:glycosyltransferase involved in cell wall biosynthesis